MNEYIIINNETDEKIIIDINVLQLLATFYKDVSKFGYPILAQRANDALNNLLIFYVVSVDNILYNELMETVLTDI